MLKKLLLVLVGALAAIFAFVVVKIAPTGTGYVAKILCSSVFVSERPAEQVLAEDLANYWYIQAEVDKGRRQTHAKLAGFAKTTAVFRPGLGCTLVHQQNPDSFQKAAFKPRGATISAEQAWPLGDTLTDTSTLGVDQTMLKNAIEAGFKEDSSQGFKRTRAVVVLYGGHLVAEKYAEGISSKTPLLGWSMSKSVLATLYGIAEHEGLLKVEEPTEIEAWSNDERSKITINDLLRMQSGLQFEERYQAMADVTKMLFEEDKMVELPRQKPQIHAPGEVFYYSSGTSNLLSWLLAHHIGEEKYRNYAQTKLFGPLGMRSTLFETDANNIYVGSSYVYASARDWARFGLLHLRKGSWNGKQIFSPSWVEYISTATKGAKKGQYGAHWWLNRGAPGNEAERRFPSLPTDTFQASGFEGQAVLVIPSRKTVIVRLGQTSNRAAWDLDSFAAGILAALPGNEAPPN